MLKNKVITTIAISFVAYIVTKELLPISYEIMIILASAIIFYLLVQNLTPAIKEFLYANTNEIFAKVNNQLTINVQQLSNQDISNNLIIQNLQHLETSLIDTGELQISEDVAEIMDVHLTRASQALDTLIKNTTN